MSSNDKNKKKRLALKCLREIHLYLYSTVYNLIYRSVYELNMDKFQT